MADTAYNIGRTMREGVTQAGRMFRGGVDTYRNIYGGGSLFGVPVNPMIGAAQSFREGYEDGAEPEPIGSVGSVGADGIPESIRRPDSLLNQEQMEIEKALSGQAFSAPSPAPMPVTQTPAPQPESYVRMSVGGREYDYGRGDRAPSLFNRNAGPQNANFLGEQYAPTTGTLSMLNEPAVPAPTQVTPEAVKTARELADLQPVSGKYGELGFTRGDMREIAKAGLIGQQDPRVQAGATEAQRGADAAQQLRALAEHLKARGATPEEIAQAQERAARDLFLSLGFQNSELGALGSYLRGSLIGG